MGLWVSPHVGQVLLGRFVLDAELFDFLSEFTNQLILDGRIFSEGPELLFRDFEFAAHKGDGLFGGLELASE